MLCGNESFSSEDNACKSCIDWFIAQDRKDLSKWPAWLRKVEIDRHFNALNSKFDPSV